MMNQLLEKVELATRSRKDEAGISEEEEEETRYSSMEMHHQNKIKRYEEREREDEIAKWREYYCSEEGMEAEKAKWSKIYYSTLKEKEKVVHEEEEEVSWEVAESESESKEGAFHGNNYTQSQPSPPLLCDDEDEVSSEFSELESESGPTLQLPPPSLPLSPQSSRYENRKEGAMMILGGDVIRTSIVEVQEGIAKSDIEELSSELF
ncbi:unnamed protein product [Lactuca virosa]|uniref:Uncharacterized protein n=1 Tax=Lactuca virosa TaxID=75947 RepID=A0AAU9LIA5_9ASTR|nr:unnamed protein product [Lactuca virosa]